MRILLSLLVAMGAWGADLVIRNGRVWTGDESKPFASTVVIRDGRIMAMGGEEVVMPEGATVIDAKGCLVTPGLNDAYLYFLGGALGLREIDLTGICTLETTTAGHRRLRGEEFRGGVRDGAADSGMVEVWSHAIGPKRLPKSFAWRSLEKAGVRLVFSSDWPASISLDPIRGIHNAVNRQTVAGLPAGGWLPAQRVSLETALRVYTLNGAYASFEEGVKGQIKPGMLADLVILSQDLFRIAPGEIPKTRVDATVFDGRAIYTRN